MCVRKASERARAVATFRRPKFKLTGNVDAAAAATCKKTGRQDPSAIGAASRSGSITSHREKRGLVGGSVCVASTFHLARALPPSEREARSEFR